jgi:DNA-binding IclR family transcriptional regulator
MERRSKASRGVAAPIHNFTGVHGLRRSVSAYLFSRWTRKGKEALLAEVLKAADAISQEWATGSQGPSVATG